MNTPTPTLAALETAEAHMIAAVHAMAARMDAIGTKPMLQALAQLRAASLAASARLATAATIAGELVASTIHDAGHALASVNAMLAPAAEPAPADTVATPEEVAAYQAVEPAPSRMPSWLSGGIVSAIVEPAPAAAATDPAPTNETPSVAIEGVEDDGHEVDLSAEPTAYPAFSAGHHEPASVTVAACSPVPGEPSPNGKPRRRVKGGRRDPLS